jgi:hypothetical protein
MTEQRLTREQVQHYATSKTHSEPVQTLASMVLGLMDERDQLQNEIAEADAAAQFQASGFAELTAKHGKALAERDAYRQALERISQSRDLDHDPDNYDDAAWTAWRALNRLGTSEVADERA